MAERLTRIADAADRVGLEQAAGMVFGTNQPHLIPVLRQLLAQPRDPVDRFSIHVQLAAQLLQAGFSKEALAELERIGPAISALPASRIPPEQKAQEAARLQGAIGLAALRIGEQENCLLNHRRHVLHLSDRSRRRPHAARRVRAGRSRRSRGG